MATKVVMPKWGTGMNEGTLLRWMKAEGDHVTEGEHLAEIETSKVTQELEAPASGTLLKIMLPEGQSAEVRTLIGVIGEPGEDISALVG